MSFNDYIIRSRAPLRISFAGGGTDVSPYFEDHGGAVLNATINRYTYVTIVPRADRLIEIKSLDYDVTFKYNIERGTKSNGQLDLVKSAIDKFRDRFGLDMGFKLYLQSDAPPGSGLGSSSTLVVAIARAFYEMLRIPFTLYELAELSYEIERIDSGLPGGKQDQYAATFGGINFIEFRHDATIVNPLKIKKSTLYELECNLVLANIGLTRLSGKIIDRQVDNYKRGKKNAVKAMHKIKEMAYDMKNLLLMDNLNEFGKMLDREWNEKKKMAAGISNEKIDNIYRQAIKAGALGGKISGAGGGGFILFYVNPFDKMNLIKKLIYLGLQVIPFSFVDEGASAWRTR